jgi:hypothetical protein
MLVSVSTIGSLPAGSFGVSGSRGSVDMAVDAPVLDTDTKLLRRHRGVYKGERSMAWGSERRG